MKADKTEQYKKPIRDPKAEQGTNRSISNQKPGKAGKLSGRPGDGLFAAREKRPPTDLKFDSGQAFFERIALTCFILLSFSIFLYSGDSIA